MVNGGAWEKGYTIFDLFESPIRGRKPHEKKRWENGARGGESRSSTLKIKRKTRIFSFLKAPLPKGGRLKPSKRAQDGFVAEEERGLG